MFDPKNLLKVDIDPIIALCYDYILPITEERMLATSGGEISLLNVNGTIICTYISIEVPSYIEFDEYNEDSKNKVSRGWGSIERYVEGLLIIRTETGVGLIDYDGYVLYEPTHNDIKFAEEDKVIVT